MHRLCSYLSENLISSHNKRNSLSFDKTFVFRNDRKPTDFVLGVMSVDNGPSLTNYYSHPAEIIGQQSEHLQFHWNLITIYIILMRLGQKQSKEFPCVFVINTFLIGKEKPTVRGRPPEIADYASQRWLKADICLTTDTYLGIIAALN